MSSKSRGSCSQPGVQQEELPCWAPGLPNLCKLSGRQNVLGTLLLPRARVPQLGHVHSGFGKGSRARSWNSELSPAILHLCPSLLPLLGPWFSLGLQVVVGPYCIPMEEQKGAELVLQSPQGMNLFGTCCRPKKGDQGVEDFRHSNK